MADDPTRFWKNQTVELRAAGFDPVEAGQKNALVTIASPYTMPTGATTGCGASPICWSTRSKIAVDKACWWGPPQCRTP